jgi:hypothetical protein
VCASFGRKLRNHELFRQRNQQLADAIGVFHSSGSDRNLGQEVMTVNVFDQPRASA